MNNTLVLPFHNPRVPLLAGRTAAFLGTEVKASWLIQAINFTDQTSVSAQNERNVLLYVLFPSLLEAMLFCFEGVVIKCLVSVQYTLE